jgi:hypothetical protein
MKFSPIILILLAGAACIPLHAEPQVLDSSTTLPVCSCPGNAIPTVLSQVGVNGGTPIICNCPAILLPTTISATTIGPTSPAIPATGITLDDNGRTFILHPGESFLLNLGTDIFDWTVDIDNQNVLARVKNILVIRGAQGIYEANNPGKAVLTAVGNPFCRNSVPACAAPSMLFKINVIVQ